MKKLSVVVLVVLAIVSAVVAYIYFTKTAGTLPHFFIGYTQGSSHKHTKHGLVFVVLTVAFLVGAWMLSGYDSNKSVQKNDTSEE